MTRTVRLAFALVVIAVLWTAGVAAAQQPASAPDSAPDPTPLGRWKTVDDKTGEIKSVVEIFDVEGELRARVVQVMSPPGDSENPMCVNCKGDLKDKPIVGMQIMWGMKADGDEYKGGRIIDPDNGKTYKCKLKLVDDGQKLEVRGYVGFSLFGRTQTWLRDESSGGPPPATR